MALLDKLHARQRGIRDECSCSIKCANSQWIMTVHAGVDVATDPRAPSLAKIVEPEEIQSKTGLAYLHSSHCLGSGECRGASLS